MNKLSLIIKNLLLALAASLMLGKLTSIAAFANNGEIEQDSLTSVLDNANKVLDYFHVGSIKAFNIVDLSKVPRFGEGYEGTSHIINYLITYAPIFFIILMSFSLGKLAYNNLKHKTTNILSFKKTKAAPFKKENDYFKKEVKASEKEIVKKEKIEVKAKIKIKKEEFNPIRPNPLLRYLLGKNYNKFA